MLVLLFLGIGLLWYIQRKVFVTYWDQKLSVKLEFKEGQIYEGDRGVLKEILVNDKRFPLPAIDVRLAINRNLKFVKDAKANSTVSDQTYKRDVFSFAGRQQITRKLHFLGERRGYYEFTDVDVSGYDFFLKHVGSINIKQNAGIYVYPSLVSTERIRLVCQEISGMVISQRKLNPDPFEFYGLREYVSTDPMNQINWKASARTGNLMVNQFDSTTNINLQILLDLEDAGVLKQEELLEEGIRIVASLAGKLVAQNMPVTFVSNGVDVKTDGFFELYMPVGAGKIKELYEKLSCINLGQIGMTGKELLEQAGKKHTDQRSYVVISKNQTEEIQSKVLELTKGNGSVLWIIPRYSYEETICPELSGVKTISWEVTV